MTNIEFVKLVASQINRNFNGDPLTLQSFIKNVELIETLISTEENVATLRQLLPSIILTKLESLRVHSNRQRYHSKYQGST